MATSRPLLFWCWLVLFAGQIARVEADVVVDEAGDEIVAVVIAGMAAQLDRLARVDAGSFELLRIQLFGEEFIAQPLIDQCAVREGRLLLFHQQAGIMRRPLLAVFAQIAAEGFHAPWAARWRCDRRESRHATE